MTPIGAELAFMMAWFSWVTGGLEFAWGKKHLGELDHFWWAKDQISFPGISLMLLQPARFGAAIWVKSKQKRFHHRRSVECPPKPHCQAGWGAWEGVLENFLYRVCCRCEQKRCIYIICSKVRWQLV